MVVHVSRNTNSLLFVKFQIDFRLTSGKRCQRNIFFRNESGCHFTVESLRLEVGIRFFINILVNLQQTSKYFSTPLFEPRLGSDINGWKN